MLRFEETYIYVFITKKGENMFKFILKKFVLALVTLWVVASATFFLMHAIPGDPFASEKKVPPLVKAKLMEKYQLDKPIIVQYGIYIKNVFLKGDLGISMKIRGRSVNGMIVNNFPKSFVLGVLAMAVSLIVGLPLGITAALNRGKAKDSVSMFIAILGVSIPSFIVAGTLQWIVILIKQSTGVSILPVAGWGELRHLVLPTLALSVSPIAVIARMMRASMIEVIGLDYVRTAKAKGVSYYAIIMKHCVRNAILPVVTYLGPLFAAITTGSFVVENIFSIPGLGKYFSQSIIDKDYTVTLGVTVFYALILIITMVIVDLTYGFIDPKIRDAKKRGA